MDDVAAAPAFEYASWLSRAGALIIDSLILSIPTAVGFALAAIGDAGDAGALAVLGLLILIAAFFLPFVYFPVMHSQEHGQTWGKRAAGIRVRTVDGGRLSGGRALARYVISVVFWFLLYIPGILDFLWPLCEDPHQ